MRNLLRRALAGVAILALVGGLSGGARAQTQMQFPTAPWGGYAPSRIQCGTLRGADMNSTADQPIPISFPSATYEIDAIVITSPSVSLTTAAGGFYPAPAKAGTAIVASSQAYSGLTAAATNAAGSVLSATLNNTTAKFDLRTIYFSLTTGQGAAATANIRVYCRLHY
jgi:hypothetical protein